VAPAQDGVTAEAAGDYQELDDPSRERQIGQAASSDTRWKVPGVLDWSTVTHNPFVDVNKDTTTLYGSDRDVFLFLVDDTNPIEAGRLSDDGVAGRIGSMIAG
jgi:hypothetical protein